jgi:hypothetical protein
MNRVVEFKDLTTSDEFILDPASFKDGESIIVFRKYETGDRRGVGVSVDVGGSHQIFFEPTQKVIKVFARGAKRA